MPNDDNKKLLAHFKNHVETSKFDFKFKHINYERKILRKIMQTVGCSTEEILKASQTHKDNFNLAWFNENYTRVPIVFGCVKLPKPIDFSAFFRTSVESLPFYSYFLELKNNYPDRPSIGLIFDHHGDGFPDLILHNNPLMLHSTAEDKCTVQFICKDGTNLFLEKFDSFLKNKSLVNLLGY